MGVCLLPGRDEAPPPGCSQRAAAREEALTRPPSGAIGWFDYSVPPPPGAMLACLSCITSLMRRIHLSLLSVSHFTTDAPLQVLLPELRLVV